MKMIKTFFGLVLIVTYLLSTSVASAADNALPESYEGLVLKHFDDIDYVYTKPDIDVNLYDSIMIVRGEVRFKENWKRDFERGSRTRVRDEDILRIKGKVADILDEAFKETFRQDDVMKLVEQPSESTLILRASIINLDVNAPDLRSSMRTSRYVHSAGEATLYLEIFDSVSGDLLARVIDHKQARDHSYLSLANSVNNAADARRGFEEWAKRLQAQFMKVKTLNER